MERTTLTATVRGTKIVRHLYGPVDQSRLAREQKDVQHRAEQLAPVPMRDMEYNEFDRGRY